MTDKVEDATRDADPPETLGLPSTTALPQAGKEPQSEVDSKDAPLQSIDGKSAPGSDDGLPINTPSKSTKGADQ
jgi:hypothetical protein